MISNRYSVSIVKVRWTPLSRHGFVEVRQRGSHIVMQKKLPQGTITVPVPDHNEIRIGTLQSIIRQSGLPRSESSADLLQTEFCKILASVSGR